MKQQTKITFKQLSTPLKAGIVGGILYIVVFSIGFLWGFFGAL